MRPGPKIATDLGLTSSYLTAMFCEQAQTIIDDGTTRTIGEPDWPEGPGTEWLENPALREAYRVDPRKTLELIQRIRIAGGLPESADN